jgi:hypothetical protein
MADTGVVYLGSRIQRHVREDMEELARFGATVVGHMFTEEDYATYYGHRVDRLTYPSLESRLLAPDGTMKVIMDASHENGLAVWLDPWCVGHVFGADTYSLFVATHPEEDQVDQNGRLLPEACLHQPVFRAFLHRWIDAAMLLEPDMLMWDEPHLCIGAWFDQPDRWGCRCALCQKLYRERYGEEMPREQSDPGVQAFQAWTLLDFLTDALQYAKSQGARNGLCVLPKHAQPGGPTWEDYASLPGLDNLGTDPYPFPDRVPDWRQWVADTTREILDLTKRHGLDNHLWFQAFDMRPEPDHLEYLEQTMPAAAAQGIQTIGVWGYHGCVDTSYCACEQPEVIWEAVGRAFRRMRGL